ncbi:branched-chain amino acid ABC transporter permease [Pusillimonas sp. SM2304]|uniref:branched-chain amino acid ABC transporter permease n=1 Tax=Pusillimonas sp. SM2304 TaxID=3073241 RepID=UPI00287541C8|nr:branched-chain amino acid ABC transporter permease [Pusillimonas sp. SM2304]MDS1139583.1 branched-chain amino acid ABC transporter permease [Pusillimonas sp. SM2304]
MTMILVQLIVSGILLGIIYALVSVGLTLIFGVSRVKNFAHGDFVMLGMYGAYVLNTTWDIDPYIGILIVAPVMFAFGWFIARLLIKPIIGAPQVAQIFATLGLGLVLQNIALFVFGADFRSATSVASGHIVRIGGVSLPLASLIASVVALVVILGLYLFLRRSYLGKAMRAVAQDRRAAALMSINVSRIDFLTFGLGAACAGIAGALLVPLMPVYPTVGFNLVLIAFVVVILGGLGSLWGALVGGIAIGLIENLSAFFIGSEMRQVAYFVVFLIVLLVRPAGLFGIKGSEKIGA